MARRTSSALHARHPSKDLCNLHALHFSARPARKNELLLFLLRPSRKHLRIGFPFNKLTMKMPPSIGLVTLNAKFIHSSLSVRYLRNAAKNAGHENVWINEFVINQPIWKVAAEILGHKPDVLGISIYIWNRRQSMELIERLKKQAPSLALVVGGPEVSFDMSSTDRYTVISGEGEAKWIEFLAHFIKGETPSPETLKVWESHGTNLPELTPAYTKGDLPQLKNRLVYMETSRGCPYLCSFCLSALDKTVRFFDDQTVHDQISLLIKGGVTKIKFVDRTFNLKPAHMKELIRWLSKFRGTAFHFEVVGELLTDDLLEFLKSVPEGMIQFEIGIQTITPSVQKTIQRKQDNSKLFSAIDRLIRNHKIHIHCDLIFGLPGESLDDILKSFEEVCTLRPHELQLGFLKFLPGAPIKNLINEYGYQYQSTPPYEFLSNNNLSATQVIYLKKFEEIFDIFYNSKRFRFSIQRLLKKRSAVEIFNSLLEHMESKNLFNQPRSLDAQYRIIHDTFSLGNDPADLDILRLDYLYAQRVHRLPQFLQLQGTGQKTWEGDRKTPLVPFLHTISISNWDAEAIPVPSPHYCAVVHAKDSSGYLSPPGLIWISPI